jgi:hypothetical protein
VTERERRKAELEDALPPRRAARLWSRLGFAEIVAVLALATAIAAWFRHG